MTSLLGTPRQWAGFTLGAALLLTGVALTIAAGAEVPFGAGSWQAFETGLVATLGVPLAPVLVVESLAVLAVSWGLLRVRPGPGTIILALAGGPAVGALLTVLPVPSTWPGAAALFGLAALLIGLGLGLYIGADVGPSAQDALFVGLYTRLPLRPGVARFLLDLVLGLAGFALGGQVGVGTVLVLVLVPPVVERSLRLGRRVAGTAPEPGATTPEEAAQPGRAAGSQDRARA